MAMRKFGIEKFVPRPKTPTDWDRIFRKYKYEVPNIAKIALTICHKGPGQTGARYFYSYALPPLRYWNKNLKVEVKTETEKAVKPTMDVEFFGGSPDKVTLDLSGMHMDAIKTKLFSLDKSRSPAGSEAPSL